MMAEKSCLLEKSMEHNNKAIWLIQKRGKIQKARLLVHELLILK